MTQKGVKRVSGERKYFAFQAAILKGATIYFALQDSFPLLKGFLCCFCLILADISFVAALLPSRGRA